MEFINRLYEYRKKYNISQDTIAMDLELSRRTIGKIERGEQNPSLNIAYKLSSYFNESVYEMFPSTITPIISKEVK